jgi:hypothetical protein
VTSSLDHRVEQPPEVTPNVSLAAGDPHIERNLYEGGSHILNLVSPIISHPHLPHLPISDSHWYPVLTLPTHFSYFLHHSRWLNFPSIVLFYHFGGPFKEIRSKNWSFFFWLINGMG